MSARVTWDIDTARALARDLELALADKGWHVALGGSVLHNGMSMKDLDLFVYPHTVTRWVGAIRQDVCDALKQLGLRRVASVDAVHDAWRKMGSKDTKSVEVWRTTDRRRVDIFYLS